MKKPAIIFILKCVAIFYISAFTNMDGIKKDKTAASLIPKGNCKINLQNCNEFSAYTFAFINNGTVLAKKDGIEITGQWAEDNSSKKINIHFNTYNAALSKLNNSWIIKDVNKNQLVIETVQNGNLGLVTIASL